MACSGNRRTDPATVQAMVPAPVRAADRKTERAVGLIAGRIAGPPASRATVRAADRRPDSRRSRISPYDSKGSKESRTVTVTSDHPGLPWATSDQSGPIRTTQDNEPTAPAKPATSRPFTPKSRLLTTQIPSLAPKTHPLTSKSHPRSSTCFSRATPRIAPIAPATRTT